MAKKIFFIILIVIGLFLRIYKFGQIPAGLFIDEATIAVDAKSIAQSGIDEYGRNYPFAFEALSDYRPPVYVYATSIVYRFLGSTLVTIRLVSLFSSISGIFLLGYFTKLLFPKRKLLPLISMAVLSLSPFDIHFARIGYETMLATTLMLVYFISLLNLMRKKSGKWLIIGSIAIIASCWTYPNPKFIIPALTLIILLLGIIRKSFDLNRKSMIYYSLFFLGICFTAYIPGILHPIYDKRPLSYIKIGTDGTLRGILTTKPGLMLSSWLSMFDFQFLFKKGDIFAFRHSTKEQGIFLQLFAIPFVLGLIYSIKNYSKKSFSIPYLAILTLIIGIPSALTSATPYGTRVLPILIPFSIFIALGIDELLVYVSGLKKYIRGALYLGTVFLLFFEIALFCHVYFVHFKTTSLPEFPKAATDMSLYVKGFRQTHPNNKVYFLNDHSCRSWSFDALHLWYFADLNNTEMAKWNNLYRTVRYAYGSPFDAYDRVTIPSYSFDNILLYPGYEGISKAPAGSLLVRCGIHLPDIDRNREKILQVFYMEQDSKQDPYYVITKKL